MGQSRYGMGAIALHWLIALLIVGSYVLVWTAEDAPEAEEARLVGLHMANGIAILVLSVLRIVWRLTHPAPPFADTLKAWEVALARVVHWLFYILLIAIPLTGWMMVSIASGGEAFSFFGMFDVPGLPFAKAEATAELMHEVHELFAGLNLLLIALHVVAALKHQLLDRDGTMRRIVPW